MDTGQWLIFLAMLAFGMIVILKAVAISDAVKPHFTAVPVLRIPLGIVARAFFVRCIGAAILVINLVALVAQLS